MCVNRSGFDCFCVFSVSDCTFEDGWCGWHNYDELLATRQTWLIYNCSSNKHFEFKGLGSDVTFAGGSSMLTLFWEYSCRKGH